MPPEPEDHPDVQVFDEIRYIEHLVRTTIARKLPVGLTYAQFEVMNLLVRRGDGITPLTIARALQTTKSGLTNTLQRLCSQGLVLVETCEADGRRRRIWLTAEGRQSYARALVAIRPNMELTERGSGMDRMAVSGKVGGERTRRKMVIRVDAIRRVQII